MREIIIQMMTHYFNDEAKAFKWYKTPHPFIDVSNKKKSPKQYVKEGKGEEVIEWLKMVINR